VTYDEVDELARALPGVTVGTKWGHKTWLVGDKGFAWERPFSKADLKRFGDATPPAGPILGVRVESLDAKDALLAIAPRGFFTIPHFDGYPAVLIALSTAKVADVRAAIADAWRAVETATTAKPARRARTRKPAPRGRSPRRRRR
jgi:hypothetical protein